MSAGHADHVFEGYTIGRITWSSQSAHATLAHKNGMSLCDSDRLEATVTCTLPPSMRNSTTLDRNARHVPRWLQGDAMALPFGPNEFDAATMGYGLRNVASIPKALQELCRVLKPGACPCCRPSVHRHGALAVMADG